MRRTGVLLMIGTVLVIFLVGSGLIPSALLKNLQVHPPIKNFDWKSSNTIVLLGSGVIQWSLPHQGDTQNDIKSTLFGYSRIHEAARLYWDCKKKSQNCTILATGGSPHKERISEAEVMHRELVELGVTDVILEKESNNTYQNAKFSSAILKMNRSDSILLVSSGAHMRRSLLYFSHFGVNAIPAPSDHLNTQLSWLPLSYNLLLTDLAIHEYLGILRFHLYNRLGWNTNNSTPGAP